MLLATREWVPKSKNYFLVSFANLDSDAVSRHQCTAAGYGRFGRTLAGFRLDESSSGR
jgi:hypothetical protein